MEEERPEEQAAPAPPAPKPMVPTNLSDMIRNLTQRRDQGQEKAIVHLSEVFHPAAIKTILESLSEQDVDRILEFLPEEQRSRQDLAGNVRSPQFQQSLDVLSDALNGENALPLFAELRLDQKALQRYFGVEAFLRALIEKARKKE